MLNWGEGDELINFQTYIARYAKTFVWDCSYEQESEVRNYCGCYVG